MAEDLTTWTEVDGGSDLAVTTSKVAVTDQPMNVDNYVHKDCGVDASGATFDIDWKLVLAIPSAWSAYAVGLCVSNVLDDLQYWTTNTSQAVSLWFEETPGPTNFYLWDHEDGSNDFYAGNAPQTIYWTLERTSETAIQARAYSDAARTSLTDTISTTITSGRRYRYILATNSKNTGSATPTWSYDVEDITIQAGFGGAGGGSSDPLGLIALPAIKPAIHPME